MRNRGGKNIGRVGGYEEGRDGEREFGASAGSGVVIVIGVVLGT